MSIILGYEQLGAVIIDHRYRNDSIDGVTTNNHTAGMHTRAAHVAFEHLSEAHHVADGRIFAVAGFSQFGHHLDAVLEVALQRLAVLFGHSVGYEARQMIGHRNGHLLDTCHILDNHLGGHSAVGDDVAHAVGTILLLYPFDNAGTSIVVEVGINIGQRDTVGVEETFEQQVILDGVDLGDAEAIGHSRTGCRATSRTYADSQLFTAGADKVRHDEEVAREAHRLHDVQLKLDAFPNRWIERIDDILIGHRLWIGSEFGLYSLVTIEGDSTTKSEEPQVVGFELDAV